MNVFSLLPCRVAQRHLLSRINRTLLHLEVLIKWNLFCNEIDLTFASSAIITWSWCGTMWQTVSYKSQHDSNFHISSRLSHSISPLEIVSRVHLWRREGREGGRNENSFRCCWISEKWKKSRVILFTICEENKFIKKLIIEYEFSRYIEMCMNITICIYILIIPILHLDKAKRWRMIWHAYSTFVHCISGRYVRFNCIDDGISRYECIGWEQQTKYCTSHVVGE